MKRTLLGTAIAGLALTCAAEAQSPDYMMEDCQDNSQTFFQDFEARSVTKYEGQRTDGTHAVNGTIYLETRSETYQCSYNAAGDTIVDFYTEGKTWPQFVRGKGSPYMDAGGNSASTSSAAEKAAQVQFPKGSSSISLEGAVSGKDFFDYALRARKGQTMTVNLRVAGTNGNGTIYFNILPPGSDNEAIFIGSRDGNSAEVRLPADGAYVVRLYLMGNDRDTGKTVGYELDVAIR